MKRQVSVLLVLGLLIAAVAVVMNLSGNDTESTQARTMDASNQTSPAPAQQPDPVEVAAGQQEPRLGPDLSQANPYEFLDLIPVGKAAPDFQARTADGKTLELGALKGKNLVMLFYQGSFCSVCGNQLANLQKHLAEFQEQNTEIIAVSADDSAHALKTLAERGLSFHVVPDPEKKIIKKFGVQNVARRNIAYPAAYVIDHEGTVRLSFADELGTRLYSRDLLPVLSKITGKPVSKASNAE